MTTARESFAMLEKETLWDAAARSHALLKARGLQYCSAQ
jgi:hypothetical protein